MGEIVYDLMVSLQEHLQLKMVEGVPDEFEALLTYEDPDEEYRVLTASLIKLGRLQQDPTKLASDSRQPSVYVGVHCNDPDEDEWRHQVASDGNLGMDVGVPYEIGGGVAWWRRFKVELQAFFIKSRQTQIEANRLANALRKLLEVYCRSVSPANPHGWTCAMTDDFGETAVQAEVARSRLMERGGPPRYYIWQGDVWVQVLTHSG